MITLVFIPPLVANDAKNKGGYLSQIKRGPTGVVRIDNYSSKCNSCQYITPSQVPLLIEPLHVALETLVEFAVLPMPLQVLT